LAEVVLDVLQPASLEIRLNEATLRAATMSATDRDGFVELREALFHELGVALPDIRIAVDDGVPDGAAAVGINAVRGGPRVLGGGTGTEPLVALLEERVRRHPSWLVALAEVHRNVDSLRLALPDLVATVLDRYEMAQLSLFARTFVDERVPVRNAARLLAFLADTPGPSTATDTVGLAEPSRRSDQQVPGIGPRGLVAYVRQQINEDTRRKHPGLTTVPHPRLPADLDETATTTEIGPAGLPADASAATRERLVELAEQALRSPGGPALIAATQRSRSVASRLLTWQYPEITVFAAEEFPSSDRLEAAR
jgi:flagellar biosynthesis component FlhA